MPACPRPGVYVPRQTHDCDAAVLVRRHLPGFLARLEESGHAQPEFVKRELEEFAGCGDFEHGCVQTVCRKCGDELRVPFSCKGRGFCPSCMGRRMAEGAALLVDHVLPAVGYRQWVLSFEGPLAVRLGYDRALLAKVAERLARAMMQDMRWSAKEHHGLAAVESLHAGVFMVVQRFRSDLGLFVHLHALAGQRGRGHLRRHAAARPAGQRYLSSPGCGIFDVLSHLDPTSVLAAPISGWPEYVAIEDHYGDTRARRSGAPYMQHIDEGLRLLANAFLSPNESHPGYDDPGRIVRSPLPEVNTMLVADKLQNYKDFLRYHRAGHPRADRLERYFQAWLTALGVDPALVERLAHETRIPTATSGAAREV